MFGFSSAIGQIPGFIILKCIIKNSTNSYIIDELKFLVAPFVRRTVLKKVLKILRWVTNVLRKLNCVVLFI